MPEDLRTDLMNVLSRHGVAGLERTATAAPVATPRLGPGTAASYIKEIITSDREFDEEVLARVAALLAPRR